MTQPARKPKERQCKAKGCENTFFQYDSLVTWCSPSCGASIAMEKLAKKEARKRMDVKRERIAAKLAFQQRDKSYQTKLTQRVFNQWIRLRDSGLPCISCGITYGQMHAGHYRSTGAAPELRFEPLNAHSQCAQCNTHKSGNIGEYRIGLIKKIGLDKVEWLEGPHAAKKYSCEELIELRAYYAKSIREHNSQPQ